MLYEGAFSRLSLDWQGTEALVLDFSLIFNLMKGAFCYDLN